MAAAWKSEFRAMKDKVGVARLGRRADPANGELFRRMVIGNNEYAIFMLDADGRILNWNRGAERIKQYRADEVIGKHFRMLYTAEDQRAGRPEKNLRDALEHGQTEDIGWRMKKDRTRFWANAVISPIYDDDGKLLGFGKVIRDLSVLNKAEALARDQEVSRRVEALKEEFLSLISHELRTPLTTIQGFADLVEDGSAGPVTAEQTTFMGSILKATALLTKHVNDLLDMTSFRARDFRLERHPMSFAEVAQGAAFVVQSRAQEKHLWLANHVNPDLPNIVADSHRVGQILVHLLDNAIKFTPAGGRIDVRAEVDAAALRCEISDTGKGIPEAAMESLFKDFSQVDMSSTRAEGGLGIGLNLSKAIIEAHGGQLGVMSEVGKGTTFWFTLPRGREIPAEGPPEARHHHA